MYKRADYITYKFMTQINSSVTEDFSVAWIAATEDTHLLELASMEPFLHSEL